MANGPLTQSLDAATASVQRILSYPDIPAAAGVQATAASYTNTLRPQILAMQQQIQTVAARSRTALTAGRDILSKAQGPLPPDQAVEVETILTGVQADCKAMASTVDPVVTAMNGFYGQVTGDSRQLADASNELSARKTALQSQIDAANSEAAVIRDRMKYYALFGTLCLPGLIAAEGLLSNARDQVNDLCARMAVLSRQVDESSLAIARISMMNGDLQSLSGAMLKVDNATNFVSSDIAEVLNDVGKSDGSAALLFINTALIELQTLANDAS